MQKRATGGIEPAARTSEDVLAGATHRAKRHPQLEVFKPQHTDEAMINPSLIF